MSDRNGMLFCDSNDELAYVTRLMTSWQLTEPKNDFVKWGSPRNKDLNVT